MGWNTPHYVDCGARGNVVGLDQGGEACLRRATGLAGEIIALGRPRPVAETGHGGPVTTFGGRGAAFGSTSKRCRLLAPGLPGAVAGRWFVVPEPDFCVQPGWLGRLSPSGDLDLRSNRGLGGLGCTGPEAGDYVKSLGHGRTRNTTAAVTQPRRGWQMKTRVST